MQAPVTLREFVRMRLKGVDQPTVVISYIRLVKSGRTGITVQDLIDHYLAGGRVPMVTNALISASRTNTDLDWEEACIADLEGRDIFEETQEKVAAILAAEQ